MMSHILEGVIIFVVGRTLYEWWGNIKTQPKEKRIESILACIELLLLALILWSDNSRSSSFTIRFTMACVWFGFCMVKFCLIEKTIHRTTLVFDLMIPLFVVVLAAVDFKIKIGFSLQE